MAENGIFRAKKGFTMVQNSITKDHSISLQAKGLYLVIQSYITMPDNQWKKDNFMTMSGLGEKKFDSIWNELKEKGYLKVHCYLVGNKYCSEYELLDEPTDGPHTFYYNSKGEVTRTNLNWQKSKNDNVDVKKSSPVKSKTQDVVDSGNDRTKYRRPSLGPLSQGTLLEGALPTGVHSQGGVLAGTLSEGTPNNNINNKKQNNTNCDISINHSNNASEFPGWPRPSEERVIEYINLVKSNIGYDSRKAKERPEDFEIFDKIYQALIDFVCSAPKEFYIDFAGKPRAFDEVRDALLKVKFDHVNYVRNQVRRVGAIAHFAPYSLTLLFNSLGMPADLLKPKKEKQSTWDFEMRQDYDFDELMMRKRQSNY